MKFGQQLLEAAAKHPGWAAHNVQYKRLKSIISAIEKACKILAPPEEEGDGDRPPPKPVPVTPFTTSVAGVVADLENSFKTLLETVGAAACARRGAARHDAGRFRVSFPHAPAVRELYQRVRAGSPAFTLQTAGGNRTYVRPPCPCVPRCCLCLRLPSC